jgi:hypothetical protein
VVENGGVILDTNTAEEQVGIVPFSEVHRRNILSTLYDGSVIIRVLSQPAAIEVLCSSGVPQFAQGGWFEGTKTERRGV